MPTVSDRIRNVVLSPESPGSLAARARANRWAQLTEGFPDLDGMQVLDLGGTIASWEHAPVRPRSVTLLNVRSDGHRADWITTLDGDACDPPAEIARRQFDLVYSNW